MNPSPPFSHLAAAEANEYLLRQCIPGADWGFRLLDELEECQVSLKEILAAKGSTSVPGHSAVPSSPAATAPSPVALSSPAAELYSPAAPAPSTAALSYPMAASFSPVARVQSPMEPSNPAAAPSPAGMYPAATPSNIDVTGFHGYPNKRMKKEFTFRGPGIQGRDMFDKYCFFTNRVKLSEAQTTLLRDEVDTAPQTDIHYYIYTMRKSCIVPPKYKMSFSTKFTNNHLAVFLDDTIENLPVYLPQHDCNSYHSVRIKIGKNDTRVMIRAHWGDIVKACKIKENDICVFAFYNCPDVGFSLCVFTG